VCRRGAKIVQLLLEHGADVNAQTAARCTSLYQASHAGYLETVQILLRHGADVHIQGEDDQTPFQVATSKGHSEIAQLLLEHGTKKKKRNKMMTDCYLHSRWLLAVSYPELYFPTPEKKGCPEVQFTAQLP
jgi:ankyrin repeat protein